MSSLINVCKLYFRKEILTRVHGEPDLDTLHGMLLEIKANLGSVSCKLGGGTHGYAGTIFSLASYSTLASKDPFLVIAHPCIQNLPTSATQYAIELFKTEHDEAERESIQEVLEVIDAKYLTRLKS